MYEEDLLGGEQDGLEFLLNYSRISEHKQESSFRQFSVSRDKSSITEKERTREESYEDVMRQIHQAKLEKADLIKQLDSNKREVYAKYLGNLQQELQEINDQNMRLRKELRSFATKKEDECSQRYSNRSPLRLKASVKSSYANQNQKTNSKTQRNRVSPNMVLLKKEIKITQSTTNLGRSQIQSPQNHKKRQSQLTERKIEDNKIMRTQMSFSILDERFDDFNMKSSVSGKLLKGQDAQSQNIFIRILEDILQQQKQYEQDKYGSLQNSLPLQAAKANDDQVLFINQMEGQISEAHQKIEMLALILGQYQKEIKQLNININDTQEWSRRLWEVKGRYVQMQKRCGSLPALRQEVQQKQQKLLRLSQNFKEAKEQQKVIPAVETMIKLLANPSKTFCQSSKLYITYFKQIKSLFKFSKQQELKRTSKVVKVRETIDSIREGRKKFNELIHIYQSRISKLQEKIGRVKGFNQK